MGGPARRGGKEEYTFKKVNRLVVEVRRFGRGRKSIWSVWRGGHMMVLALSVHMKLACTCLKRQWFHHISLPPLPNLVISPMCSVQLSG